MLDVHPIFIIANVLQYCLELKLSQTYEDKFAPYCQDFFKTYELKYY